MVFENFHAPDYENVDLTLFDVARVCRTWRSTVIAIVCQVDASKLDVRPVPFMSTFIKKLESDCAEQRVESERRIVEQIARRQKFTETFQRHFQTEQIWGKWASADKFIKLKYKHYEC